MRQRYFGPVVLAGALAIAAIEGCSHNGAEKKLDAQLAEMPPVASLKALNQETKQKIETAPNLTASQREQLLALRAETSASSAKLREESLKLRSLLVQTVASPDYDADEVSLIKKRIQENDKKRLTVLFKAVDKANDILGHKDGHRPILMGFMRDQNPWLY